MAKNNKNKNKNRNKFAAVSYAPDTPATPGVVNPPAPPFASGADLMSQADRRLQYLNTLGDADYELERQRLEKEFEQQQIEKGRKVGLNQTDYEMAGRGLAHSSIRDTDLWDINATASAKSKYLDTQFQASTLNAQRQKTAARNAWDAYMKGLNQTMVENAQAASAGQPAYLVEPTPAVPGKPGKPGRGGNGNGGGNGGGGNGGGGKGNASFTPNKAVYGG